jgi:hypothetical protein
VELEGWPLLGNGLVNMFLQGQIHSDHTENTVSSSSFIVYSLLQEHVYGAIGYFPCSEKVSRGL